MANNDMADHRRYEDGEHSDNDIEDDEIDEELALPDILTNLGIGEKRELLRFKNTHTEIEWEEEVLRRTDLLARKIDLERLKKMTKGATASSMDGNKVSKVAPKRGSKAAKAAALDDDEDERPKGRKAPARTAKSKKAVKQQQLSSEEEEASDEDLGDSAEEDFADLEDVDEKAGGGGDSDDDLFDTDEEEEITNRFTKHEDDEEEEDEDEDERPRKKKAAAAKKGKAAPAKSKRLQRGRKDSDDEEEEAAEESDDSDLYGSSRKRKASATTKSRKKKTSNYAISSDEESGEDDEAADDLADDDDADIEGVKSQTPATLEDYWRIQIRRSAVTKYIKEPFFDDFMKGGFVKILIGAPNGVKVYRVAEIASIEHDLPSYKDNVLNQTVTHRMTLKCGKTLMPRVRYEIISESRITEAEFEVYLQSGGNALTQTQIQSRRKKQQGYMNHVYTHDEISKMVSKNTGFVVEVAQTEYATALERLKKKLNDAMTRPGEEKLVLQLSKAIQKIEDDSATQKLLFDKATKKNTEVNARNRRNNVERDGAAGRAGMAEEAAGSREEAIKKDPFSRRETKPKILWKTSQILEVEAKELKEKEEKEKVEKANGGVAAAVAPSTSSAGSNGAAGSGAAGGGLVAGTEETPAQLAAKKKAAKMLLMRQLNAEGFMAEMRKNVKRRLGIDPVEYALVPQRVRYLSKVTAGLPPLGSEERQRLKGNSKTWAEVLGR